MVEYEDEFGRIRTARQSEVPRNFVPPPEDEQDEDEYVAKFTSFHLVSLNNSIAKRDIIIREHSC